LKHYDFDFYGYRHFMELFGIEEHKNALFYTTPSVAVSFCIYQLPFADDTDA
jgi:hypothetical protein